jgi:putative hemolysin
LTGLWQYFWRIVFMAALLLCSAFMSGSETAFFHLSHRQISQFARSPHKLESLIAHVLNTPGRFLTTLLFGNMLVNVTYFALAGVLSVELSRQFGAGAAAVAAVIIFFLLVMFGELLPKSIAYANTGVFARAASLPCWLLLKTLGPVLAAVDLLLVRPVTRLFLGSALTAPPRPVVGPREFRLLLDSSRRQGLISYEENQLLMEVLKLGFLKVRDVMTPRVDMITAELSVGSSDLIKLMREVKKKFVPLYKGEFDNIVGFVTLRDLLLSPDQPPRKLLRPIRFVPEQQTVEAFLGFLREQHADLAIVVDEYGGVAGLAGMDDLVEELLGLPEEESQAPPVEQIGPLTYRLSAELSIHDWIDAFGVSPEQKRLSTVGGLVTVLLGRVARPGDVVAWKNMKFTVESVRKNRIRTLILSLEPTERNNNEF